MKKACKRCNAEKDIDCFRLNIRRKDGHGDICVDCFTKHKKEVRGKYWADNRERLLAASRERRLKNKDRDLLKIRAWQKQHPERTRELCRQATARWRARNPKESRERHRIRQQAVRATPKGQINARVTRLIISAIRENKAGRHWETLVDFTLEQLMRHLEKHFLPGMNWGNMGEWHIDHKIPKAAFNFKTAEDIDFKRCWALKNLQPLWKFDNLSKNAKLERPFQPSLAIGGQL
jgi:hypothetical protein